MENFNKSYISINGQVVDSAIFFEESSFEKIKRALYNRNKYRIMKNDDVDIWFDKITFVNDINKINYGKNRKKIVLL